MKRKKIILDTNLWISFLITQNYTEIDNLIIERKIRLIFSRELIEEFITVASRPKFKPKISNRKSQALFIADRLRISSVLVIHLNRELLDRG